MPNHPMCEDELASLLMNPFYAVNVTPDLSVPHGPLFTKDEWIQANKGLLEELGTNAYLEKLLAVLEGDYPVA